ncbi:MAG: ABC transporter ATP-binding protein [Gemmobacter sp.]|nr:ABC transporter ATP-binding protein [Gemmobacter sp.]
MTTQTPEHGPLLEVRNLSVSFPVPGGKLLRIIEDVSFSIARHEVFSIVGESGSGKSVTMMAVMRLLPEGAVVTGQVLYKGQDLLTMQPETLRRIRGSGISMVFQEPMSSLNPVLRIGPQIAEIIDIHHPGQTDAALRARVAELLGLVGVPSPEKRYDQYPHEFSGGMRQRVMIAMAIANEPDLIIADEPTTALDVTIQAQVMEVLRDVRAATGSSMVLITHDLGLVAENADRVAVTYGGRLAEQGQCRDVFAHPAHPYTVGLLQSVPDWRAPIDRELAAIPGQPPNPTNRPAGCAFSTRCPIARDSCTDIRPELAPVADDHMAACPWTRPGEAAMAPPRASLPPRPALSQAEDVLRVDGLRTHFALRTGWFGPRSAVKAVDGVDLQLRRGETLGIVGESGCGKSTLGRTILDLIPPTEGRISILGAPNGSLRGRALRQARRRLQVVFQDPNSSLDPQMSVHEIVAEPLRIHGDYTPARVDELLGQVGLDASAGVRRPSAFSGGQRQRIAIARALALQPDIMLLDEAVSALDVSIQAQIVNLLMTLQRDLGLSYLFISHDLSVVRHISDTVAVMYLGKIVEYGARDDIFARPRHPYTRALLSAVPVLRPEDGAVSERVVLTGDLPNPANPPSGCVFRTRCPVARDLCAQKMPALTGQADGHRFACHFPQG